MGESAYPHLKVCEQGLPSPPWEIGAWFQKEALIPLGPISPLLLCTLLSASV